MMDYISKHKVIIGLVAFVIAAVAWYELYGGSSSADTPILSTNTEISGPGQDVVQVLGQLHTISLNAGIFTDPVFMGLKDFGTQIVPEPVGRPNPFAPVSVAAAPVSAADLKLFGAKH